MARFILKIEKLGVDSLVLKRYQAHREIIFPAEFSKEDRETIFPADFSKQDRETIFLAESNFPNFALMKVKGRQRCITGRAFTTRSVPSFY